LNTPTEEHSGTAAENGLDSGRQRRSLLRSGGCAVAVLVWAVLMLIPFLLFALAVRGEISLNTGPAPEQRLRVWLIMEPAQRGVGISTAAAFSNGDNTCVQTDVHFVLWQGGPEEAHTYCECYRRADDGDWVALGALDGACPAE